MFIYKASNGWPHINSTHAIAGAISITLVVGAAVVVVSAAAVVVVVSSLSELHAAAMSAKAMARTMRGILLMLTPVSIGRCVRPNQQTQVTPLLDVMPKQLSSEGR